MQSLPPNHRGSEETEAQEGSEGFVIQDLGSPHTQGFVDFWDLPGIHLHSKTVPVSAGLGLKPAAEERETHPRLQHKILNFSLTPIYRWEMLENLPCNRVPLCSQNSRKIKYPSTTV